jgi:hypothetical protein
VSKMFESCVMCHDEPPADRFGWCDTCARLYDHPDDPTEQEIREAREDFYRLKLDALMLASLFGDYKAMRSAQ